MFLLIQYVGWTAIHHASCEGHTDIVEVLVNNGADVNFVTTEVV